jgi:predicted RNA-binding Zn ribbon-like protein
LAAPPRARQIRAEPLPAAVLVKPLFRAGHLALDFVNTTISPEGTPVELIGDGRAFLDWLAAAGVLDSAAAPPLARRLGTVALDELAADARKLRSWAASWLGRWRIAPHDRYEPELRRLNAWLEGDHACRQVVRRNGSLAIIERRPSDTGAEILGALAAQIADLVVNEQPELVKRCDGADCTLWFLDRTKGHRRRFCSVAACGNRDKVAAFRARQRQQSSSRVLPRPAKPTPGSKR